MNARAASGKDMAQQEIYPIVDGPVSAGIWSRIVDGVYWARIPLPFRLDHVNVWLLEDGEGWAIVDCGIDSAEVRAIWAQLLASLPGERPITRIIVTHGHTDHIGCAGHLVSTLGVPFHAPLIEWLSARLRHAASLTTLPDATASFLLRHGCDETMLQAFDDERLRVSQYLGAPPAELRRISNGDRLQVGGRSWAVIVAGGHADEHVSLYCEADGLLLAGDQILPRISPVVAVFAHEPDASPLGKYLISLDQFLSIPEGVLVLPGHGLPFRGLHARIAALRQHHVDRLDQLETVLAEPKTAFEAGSILFSRAFEGGHRRLALGETLAHLHVLVQQGRASVRTDQQGRQIFYRTGG
ncbi:glyoxylase-like metal-dependent hydrolase (beta-lactamase superfamily II) [Bosea sp. BK604]|nr:glyoxylase-like metal-dependent hydrolase (beta-lactamase superfamily II) [Bosea sp. BK604]